MQASEPYDRCYHEACDTIDNVNREVLDHYIVDAGVVAGGPGGGPVAAVTTARLKTEAVLDAATAAH